jgi:hypothetical protein
MAGGSNTAEIDESTKDRTTGIRATNTNSSGGRSFDASKMTGNILLPKIGANEDEFNFKTA